MLALEKLKLDYCLLYVSVGEREEGVGGGTDEKAVQAMRGSSPD